MLIHAHPSLDHQQSCMNHWRLAAENTTQRYKIRKWQPLLWRQRPTDKQSVKTAASTHPTEVCHLGVVVRLMHRWPGRFLRATAGTAIARLSHRNSVCPSVRPSVTRVDQAKTVQARIIKSSPSAAPRTLVSGSVTLFQKFRRGHPNRGP